MVIDIIELLLTDFQRLVRYGDTSAVISLGPDYDDKYFVDFYNKNRSRVFDIVREMSLGASVTMEDLELQFPPAQYGSLK